MNKCVLAPDSFKGTISSMEICEIMRGEIKNIFPRCQVISAPVADGGEGTVECLHKSMGGEIVRHMAAGVFFESMEASYLRAGDTAVIELAATAGLPLAGNNRNPLLATTVGSGQQIAHAISNGAKKIIIALGGTATNDGGCGMAQALGVKFINGAGEEFIPVGATLSQIAKIDIREARERLRGIEITAMCDITNPMHGKRGAAYVFAPQKGADADMVRLLDNGLISLDNAISRELNMPQIAEMPGAGAAGGAGAGVAAFLGGKLRSGIDTVLEAIDFKQMIKGADLIFTGEGRIDSQSIDGKVVSGVCAAAKAEGIPVVAIVGDVGEGADMAYDIGVSAIFSINRQAIPFEEAKYRVREYLKDMFDDVLRLIRVVDAISDPKH